ncbi:hypothetical protein ABKN59_007208 [Abortiporus biennis]
MDPAHSFGLALGLLPIPPSTPTFPSLLTSSAHHRRYSSCIFKTQCSLVLNFLLFLRSIWSTQSSYTPIAYPTFLHIGRFRETYH